MKDQSLGGYLKTLEAERPGDFLDVPGTIDPEYTFQALALELDKEQYPPIIRTRVEGYEDVVTVGNVFASRRRIAEMIGEGGEKAVTKNWTRIEKSPIAPVMVESGPVQEVFESGNVDMSFLPLMKYYSTDAGRYISSSIVCVKDPETGIRNLSYHRMQFKGGNKFGISMHTRQHLFYCYEKAREMGKEGYRIRLQMRQCARIDREAEGLLEKLRLLRSCGAPYWNKEESYGFIFDGRGGPDREDRSDGRGGGPETDRDRSESPGPAPDLGPEKTVRDADARQDTPGEPAPLRG